MTILAYIGAIYGVLVFLCAGVGVFLQWMVAHALMEHAADSDAKLLAAPCSKSGNAHDMTEMRIVGFDPRSNYIELRCACGLVTHISPPPRWRLPTQTASRLLDKKQA